MAAADHRRPDQRTPRPSPGRPPTWSIWSSLAPIGPLVGQGVALIFANGTFGSAGRSMHRADQPTPTSLSTDHADGNVLDPRLRHERHPSGRRLTVQSATATWANPGARHVSGSHHLGFDLQPRVLVGTTSVLRPTPPAPTPPVARLGGDTDSSGTCQTGTVSVQKSGDDTAYYGLAGAVFQTWSREAPWWLPHHRCLGCHAGSFESAASRDLHRSTKRAATDGYGVAPDESVTVSAKISTRWRSFTGAMRTTSCRRP